VTTALRLVRRSAPRRAAEAAGLDSVWIYDHLLYRFPGKPPQGIWEGWTVMAALGEATERVELGALVLCTAFRNPAVLAKMATTLDEITGGRIILGLGAGWHEPEFSAFGLPFDHLVDRFGEALQIIVPLLRDGEVDFTGKYFSAPNCALLPKPARRIPILIASAKERMHKLTAQYADQWNTAWVGEVSATEERRSALLAACDAVGRDPRTLEQTVGSTSSFRTCRARTLRSGIRRRRCGEAWMRWRPDCAAMPRLASAT
jgi:alkanesulfonate monooxygenase SsuD/methylene tetrahydromethanopterin reductase-like flavin-dependent oxidoreductase (luciferase family)